ncbi:hypothetical protein TWF694_003394 [Orbilia ellipsospora]|uniref:F-box domain-containing protein n=1 Tax=Orbilia ellipsospora TaxID=2528407 RepID=A0AAV9X412_9PEZI
MNTAASTNVLSTSELLEQILCHVDPLELLTVAKAVCKFWKRLLETSPLLKWMTWTYDGHEPPKSILNQRPSPSHYHNSFERSPFLEFVMKRFYKELLNLKLEDRNETGLQKTYENATTWINRFGTDLKVCRPIPKSMGVKFHFERYSALLQPEYTPREYSRWAQSMESKSWEKNVGQKGSDFAGFLRLAYVHAISNKGINLAEDVWKYVKRERSFASQIGVPWEAQMCDRWLDIFVWEEKEESPDLLRGGMMITIFRIDCRGFNLPRLLE